MLVFQCRNGAKMGPCLLDGFANVVKAPMMGPVSGGCTYVVKVGSPHRWKSSDNSRLGATRHYPLLVHLPVNGVSLA
jgi:hypothetical protein